jgi:hypothetical protein
VTLLVNNTKFGLAIPSDFTVSVITGQSPLTAAVEDGPVLFGLVNGLNYTVSAAGPEGYDITRSGACAGTSAPGTRTCTLTLVEQPMTCDETLWSRTYLRDRLRVLSPCQAASGVVVDVGLEEDADLVMEFVPDPAYAFLLRPGNKTNPVAHGNLVVEVPCQGTTREPAPRETCASFTGAKITPPARGAHIVVAAHWVEDLNHSAWGELHGARIRILPR